MYLSVTVAMMRAFGTRRAVLVFFIRVTEKAGIEIEWQGCVTELLKMVVTEPEDKSESSIGLKILVGNLYLCVFSKDLGMKTNPVF